MKSKAGLTLLIVLTLVLTLPAAVGRAQSNLTAGSLDPTFNEDGRRIESGSNAAADLRVQPDGKVLVLADAGDGILLVRLSPDGSRDNSFSGDGRIQSTINNVTVTARSLLLQPDGKVVIVGQADQGAQAGVALLRYLPNGDLDSSFAGGGKTYALYTAEEYADFSAYTATLLADGKFMVAGVMSVSYDDRDPNHARFLARFNSDGSPDASFGQGGWAVDWYVGSEEFVETMYDLDEEASGSLLLVGQHKNEDHAWWSINRFNADGSPALRIQEPDQWLMDQNNACRNVFCQDFATSVVVQPDGKFIVAGTFTKLYGPFGDDWYQTFYMVRYNPDGSWDTSFGDEGWVATTVTPTPFHDGIQDEAWDIALQSDGKIVVVGGSEGDFAVARYLPDGSLEASFGNGGIQTTAFGGTEKATEVEIAPDGKIVVAGQRSTGVPIARYLSSGQIGQAEEHRIWLPIIQ